MTTTNNDLTELAPFIRTKDGCYRLQDSAYWGKYYVKVKDPKGSDAPDTLEYLWLKPDFPKMPFELLQGIITFFRKYAVDQGVTGNEVQVCLLRSETDPSKWKVVVPRQVVSGGTVDAELNHNCDLFTGEKYTSFPPEGWCHAGSIHSHVQMPAFWSVRDDKGELGVPGMHCTIGKISETKFDIVASVVVNKRRYIFDPTLLLTIDCNTKSTDNSLKTVTVKDKGKSVEISLEAYNYVICPAAVKDKGKSVEISLEAYNYVICPAAVNYTATVRDSAKIRNNQNRLDNPNYDFGYDWYDYDWYDYEGIKLNPRNYNTSKYYSSLKTEQENYTDFKDKLKHRHYYDPATISDCLNCKELKDTLAWLDNALDKMLEIPKGEELIAQLVAYKLGIEVNLPCSVEILNTLLY